MTFIALAAPSTTGGAASESHPGIGGEATPFGITVEPSAAEVHRLIASLDGAGILAVAREQDGAVVYINAAAILYFTD
jgi:hypothetical protein